MKNKPESKGIKEWSMIMYEWCGDETLASAFPFPVCLSCIKGGLGGGCLG